LSKIAGDARDKKLDPRRVRSEYDRDRKLEGSTLVILGVVTLLMQLPFARTEEKSAL
jgi:hypothetical protein